MWLGISELKNLLLSCTMELNDGFVLEEHREWLKAVTESADPTSVSPLEITSPESPISPRSPRTHRGKHSPNKGSPVKHNRHSLSGRDGRPKKGMLLFPFPCFT